MNHRTHWHDLKTIKQFIGHFAKIGYQHKDKRHQIILPSRDSGKSWPEQKINHFSSKRFASESLKGTMLDDSLIEVMKAMVLQKS